MEPHVVGDGARDARKVGDLVGDAVPSTVVLVGWGVGGGFGEEMVFFDDWRECDHALKAMRRVSHVLLNQSKAVITGCR